MTRITTTEHLQGVSLAGVAIATGRTHQIRVHLSAIGHPVVGDSLYGGIHRHTAATPPRSSAPRTAVPPCGSSVVPAHPTGRANASSFDSELTTRLAKRVGRCTSRQPEPHVQAGSPALVTSTCQENQEKLDARALGNRRQQPHGPRRTEPSLPVATAFGFRMGARRRWMSSDTSRRLFSSRCPMPDHIVLVRQYRYANRPVDLGTPRGQCRPRGRYRDGGSARVSRGDRSGTRAASSVSQSFYPTPGYSDELMVFLRLVQLSTPTEPADQDEDEILEPKVFEVGEVWARIQRGEIQDMKTALGVRMLLDGPVNL